jgi:hypothetical protein
MAARDAQIARCREREPLVDGIVVSWLIIIDLGLALFMVASKGCMFNSWKARNIKLDAASLLLFSVFGWMYLIYPSSHLSQLDIFTPDSWLWTSV